MKKGFTLIELLAVIVILAIISVIAVPIVMSIINSGRESSTINSGEFYLNSLEQAITQENDNTFEDFKPTTCFIQSDGNAVCDSRTLKININGERPTGGVIVYDGNKLKAAELIYQSSYITLTDGNKFVYNNTSGKSSTHKTVYFDVEKGKLCSEREYNEENSKSGYNGIANKEGNQNSCLKFYLIKDNGNTMDLILDHNTTIEVAWNSSKTYSGGPKEVMVQLNEDTKDWTGVNTPTNYTVNNDLASYTVDYSSHKARLLTIEEIVEITKNTNWDGSFFYLDTGSEDIRKEDCKYGNTLGCQYGWLYDRTSYNCELTGCLNPSELSDVVGYWTASSSHVLSDALGHSRCTGHVTYGISYVGRVGYACVDSYTHYGIRPVINISK